MSRICETGSLANLLLVYYFFVNVLKFPGAMAVVTEIMIQESFDEVSTQLLALYVMYNYLKNKPELTVSCLCNKNWYQVVRLGKG